MANDVNSIIAALSHSISASSRRPEPYPHWNLVGCLPTSVAGELCDLPFPAPALGGVSGKREIHNATRKYFDVDNRRAFPVVEAFAQAFQSPEVTGLVGRHFGARLEGSYLRLEYAQDTNGFWLEPHTDLGVKTFTMLLYLSRDASHADLGTDIYDSEKRHVGRSPFASNAAMVFVPSDKTYHGFEAREIAGIRKSIIINYVTQEWRAREQLSFPDNPVAA